jgi:hypothetical protein
MDVNTLVLHTTETTGLPDYGGGSQAPTLTAIPDMTAKRLIWYQHFDIDVSARALVNAPGGVETNTLNAAQVELGGTCDAAHRGAWGTRLAGVDYVYWPEPPGWALQGLADFLRWLHRGHGVPLTAPPVWLAYGPDPRRPGVTPASYGASPARMTPAQWEAFTGVCGHSHVPENDHGDPGALPITKLLALAGNTLQEDDMTPEQAEQLADLHANLMKIDRTNVAKPETHAAGYFLAVGEGHAHSADTKLDAVADRLGNLEAAVAAISAHLGIGSGTP